MLSHRLRRATPKVAYPQYVGGTTNSEAATTFSEPGQISVDLTTLSGGLASSPQAGDLVLIVIGSSGTQVDDYDVKMVTSGYTEQVELFSSDTQKTNFGVYTKIMGATPDTVATGASGFNSQYRVMLAQVWRGVHATTPLDVALTSATGINGATVTPPSITPTTPKSLIVVMGSGSDVGNSSNGLSALTVPSGMSTFLGATCYQNTYLVAASGMAVYEWQGGAYTPAAFGGGSTTAYASWAAATLALRPA